MRIRLFVELPIEPHEQWSTEIAGDMGIRAAKEFVRGALAVAGTCAAAHSLAYQCSVGPALVFGARTVHNNCDQASAARALTNAMDCRAAENELIAAKFNAELVLRNLALAGVARDELDAAYAAFDDLVYPLTGQHVEAAPGRKDD